METISSYLLTFLLNSLWQIPLFAGVAMLLSATMPNGPSAHRHALWVAALIASIGVPIYSSAPREERIAPMALVASYEAAGQTGSVRQSLPMEAQTEATSQRRTLPFTASATQFVLGAYFLFLLYRLARLTQSWLNTLRVQQSAFGVDLPPAAEMVWDRCRRAFGVLHAEFRVSDQLQSPVTAGALRPSVILPVSMMTATSEDVLTSAIGHELAHVARRDYAFNLVYELLLLPISFHPAARWIARSIRETRELACDELVTQRVLKADVYARSLIEIASNALTPVRPNYTMGVFDSDILEHRVRTLLKQRISRGRRGRALLGGAFACLALCAIFVSGSAILARAQSGAETELKLAETAYNKHDFAASIRHFQAAASMDATNVKTKLFLANALIARWFSEKAEPFSPYAAAAQQQYEQALAYEPGNKQALHGLAGIAMNSRRPKEALEIARKLIAADSSDATAYYTAGVAHWAIAYEDYAVSKNAAGYPVQEYFLPDPGLRKSLRSRHAKDIDEGLKVLDRAVRLRPDFDEAMAYTNLLLRLKGGIVETEAESKELIEEADAWVGKALALMRQKKQNPPAKALLSVDGPPPDLAETRKLLPVIPAPPPPPPPPPGYKAAAR